MILELAALGLFAMAIHRPVFTKHLPQVFLLALAFFAFLPILQLLPLPFSVWSMIPGRSEYVAALTSLFGSYDISGHSFAVVPKATEAAFLTMLPPLAVFLVAVGLPDRRLKQVMYVFLGVATFQAVLGLAQYGTGSSAVFWSSPELVVQNGIGTYAQYNHLAGLLEMALPIALGMLALHFHNIHHSSRRYRRKGLRDRLAQAFSHEMGINRTALFATTSLAILLGLIFTRSRTGIGLGMLGLLMAALLFARRLGGRFSSSITTMISVLGLVLAMEVGLAPVYQRFGLDATEDSRWSIFAGSLKAIGDFFPFGSGIGTFPQVYRRFQPGDIGGIFINHAHNDYLEWLVETGLFGGILALVFLGFYAWGWRRVWTREHWNTLRFMQVGAGIALLLLLLHGLTDYNLHIPANAIYFAFLAAVFLHRQEKAEVKVKKTEAPKPPHRPIKELVPANVPNPFAE